jgi:hypothetical protein
MRGLDHDNTDHSARDQAVAPREITGSWHMPHRHFRNRAAAFQYCR